MTSPAPRHPQPPRLALRLLAARLAGDEAEALTGDLVEEFHAARVPRLGAARARRWFWRETLLALLTVRRDTLPAPEPSRGDPPVLSFLADLRHALLDSAYLQPAGHRLQPRARDDAAEEL